MVGNIPFRIDDERHRKLKMRAFDYKMPMNDYLKAILDMSFSFSDEEFFEFIKANSNGFETLYKESDVRKVLFKELGDIQNEEVINKIIDTLSKLNVKMKEE